MRKLERAQVSLSSQRVRAGGGPTRNSCSDSAPSSAQPCARTSWPPAEQRSQPRKREDCTAPFRPSSRTGKTNHLRSGCYSKAAQTRRLVNNRRSFLPVLEAGVWGQGASVAGFGDPAADTCTQRDAASPLSSTHPNKNVSDVHRSASRSHQGCRSPTCPPTDGGTHAPRAVHTAECRPPITGSLARSRTGRSLGTSCSLKGARHKRTYAARFHPYEISETASLQRQETGFQGPGAGRGAA